jgi:beta-mannosidase
MKRSLVLCCIAAIVILSFAFKTRKTFPPVESPGRMTMLLSGSDWLIHAADGTALPNDTGWLSARVPGNIQSDLENRHLLDPLSYGAGDPRLEEVCQKDWWYKKNFIAPATVSGKRNVLVFDGVDYSCQVWLNGRLLGKNAGMFRRFEFDVTDIVLPGKNNVLAVKVDKIPDELLPYIVGSNGKNSGAGTDYYFLNGINKTRKTLKDLKTATNFGWDWGTNIWTLGIWKDVRFESTSASRIQWTRVRSELSDAYKTANISVMLNVNTSGNAGVGKLKLRLKGNGSDKATISNVSLREGDNVLTGTIRLQDPALWWPNGQGAQPLYTVESILQAGDGSILDSVSTRFGIRELTWGEVDDAPKNVPQDATKAPGLSRPNRLYVNGRAVRMLGCNLAPPNLYPGNIMENGPKLIQLAHDAHINTLRLNGAGLILPEKMFDLADELGIMLTAEIPLANSSPEQDSVFVNNLTATTRSIVRQIRNHPAIVEWSGGNEMAWWTGLDHKALNAIAKTIEEEDGRLFRATSPVQGGRHGKYFYLPSNYSHYNDMSLTEHWGKGIMMRAAEYGAESPANLEVWQRDIPLPDRWPLTPETDGGKPSLIRKNIFFAMGEEWWLGKDVISALFGESKNLEQMIQAGQFLGAEGIRLASDALRRRGGKLGGMFTWVFNEPWSNGAGSFQVDHDGNPLMNYYFEKDALSPVAISLKYYSITYHGKKGIDTELWLTSDLPGTANNLSWQYTIRTSDGSVVGKGKGETSVAPLQAIKVKDIHIDPPKDLGPVLVELKVTDGGSKVYSERVHVFGLDGVGSVLAGLLNNSPGDTKNTGVSANVPQIQSAANAVNFAYTGNGASPAKASSVSGNGSFNAAFLNDGKYGMANASKGDTLHSYFQIDLGRERNIGRYKIGSDRTGEYDKPLGAIKIETSLDAQTWAPAFDYASFPDMPAYTPRSTVEILTVPTAARYVRVKVEEGVADEFEAYAPLPHPPLALPAAKVEHLSNFIVPIRRTQLAVTSAMLPVKDGKESLEVVLKNTGKMTALFSSVQPLISHRNDLFFSNNFIIVPPGESRKIIVKAALPSPGGLTLAQTGWKIRSWNADDVILLPSKEVLLSFGRDDAMSQEFLSNGKDGPKSGEYKVAVSGSAPDAALIPWLVTPQSALTVTIDIPTANQAARLYIHTSDQSASAATIIIDINGKIFSPVLPSGMGKQNNIPWQLAYPYTATINIPAGVLVRGKNTIKIKTKTGWFTWDACEMIQLKK